VNGNRRPRAATAAANVLLAMALTASACTASAATVPLEPVPERLAAIVEAWRQRGDVPAASIVIRRDDAEVWRGTSGRPALDGTGSLDPNPQFRIASITKLFVATLTMLLVEDGVLRLDDEVGSILTSLPTAERVTVRQLLNHTSGIPDNGTETFVAGLIAQRDRRWSAADVLATVADDRHTFAPGAGWEYSNSNYVALAAVIEHVTGSGWVEQLRSRVLEPLDLDSTYAAGFEPQRGDRLIPVGYFDIDTDGDYEDVEAGPWPALETSEGAAGAMVSTAGDVARFTEALFAGRIVAAPSMRAMVEPGPFARRYDSYGLGVERSHPDLQTLFIGHGGVVPGFRSGTWFVPSQDLTITVMANHALANPGDLAVQLLAALT
jgi:D-alanyl-D-alanine carboxypeptidase